MARLRKVAAHSLLALGFLALILVALLPVNKYGAIDPALGGALDCDGPIRTAINFGAGLIPAVAGAFLLWPRPKTTVLLVLAALAVLGAKAPELVRETRRNVAEPQCNGQ